MLAQTIAEQANAAGNLADFSDIALRKLDAAVNNWRVKPAGSEGYRTAEVTLGGIDTRDLDAKTMQAGLLDLVSVKALRQRILSEPLLVGGLVDKSGKITGINV